jgi:hypothetical protein
VTSTDISVPAGAQLGGALRFLTALDAYLGGGGSATVTLIGRGRTVDASWLVRRESRRRCSAVVAINNVSFVATRGERRVLRRNPLHLLRAEVQARPGGLSARRYARQSVAVRAAARRADTIVVPTPGMADRVRRIFPGLAARIAVRAHPLLPAAEESGGQPERGRFLCPVLFSPWKNMGPVLSAVDRAVAIAQADSDVPIRVLVTATEQEAAATGLRAADSLRFIGRLRPGELAEVRARCHATLYPTRIQSFGYPLAGDALVPGRRERPDDIADALRRAIAAELGPLPANLSNPAAYFAWLFGPDLR